MRLFLLRHGETVWNREKRWQGRGDSPLTLRGIAQARACGEALRDLLREPAAAELHASPLFRARQTAAIVAEMLDLPGERQRSSSLLAECDFGVWEGLTPDDVRERYPGAIEERSRSKWSYLLPRGESYAQVHERARRWLGELHAEGEVVVVTHGVTSRVLRGAYLGLDPEAILAVDVHPQDRIYRLSDGRVEAIQLAVEE
jgi:broad specificity phosphatase PhoE